MQLLRGVPLKEAFRQFVGQEAWCELDRRQKAWQGATPQTTDRDERKRIGDAYWNLRFQLERQFVEALMAGRLRASAFKRPVEPHSSREFIGQDIWELLEVDFEDSSARNLGLELVRIEIFRGLTEVRPALAVAPPQVADGPEFEHNEDYTSVRIREHRFILSQQLGKVIARFHQASLEGSPSLVAKAVLKEAQFKSDCFASVFKGHTDPSWRELLVTTSTRGHWRLNLLGHKPEPEPN
ncbi:hypothetical protein F0L46_22985 [Salinarimonas soli]|uniref:Uncharacterized protein n=2 Tax=Salinarimonas soli TaxID=1638099 RepID=A0A5B2V8T2_9HYPH|nr:hypothetical protein F0L46_22985 [Salinarimonas soli]